MKKADQEAGAVQPEGAAGQPRKAHFGLILAVYLLGIFMGALDTGIVTPARTIIQNYLQVDDSTGIWMITIYTLAYAASIPVMGKLADRMGRKYIYIAGITLFGVGSLFCGLSEHAGSFAWLLIARAVQAVGGGGIMPVATAEFGTTFPKDKRGMALGLVGGVYGIANIFGSSVGSAILDLFGSDNWQFIFYLNVPITVFIVAAGLVVLPNTREEAVEPIDAVGTLVLVVMILSLMYALRNLDFFDLAGSLAGTDVWPFLVLFAALVPLFIFVEKRARDPIMNLSYFTSRSIVIVLLLSMVAGFVLMGVIFIPQFCENAMKVASGKGGYFVIILGAFSGIAAPLSGRLTDRIGPKLVLMFGFLSALAGALTLIFWATVHPGWPSIITTLALLGLGIGFSVGAPLNYMMLEHTREREANSALATLSLVRSIGTVIAPALMAGFIAHAGMQVQDQISDALPDVVKVPQLPYAAELNKEMKARGVKGVPDLTSMTTIKIDPGNKDKADAGIKISDALLERLQSSDVTTITANAKLFAGEMFKQMTPAIQKKIDQGIGQGYDSVQDARASLDKKIASMRDGIRGVQKGIDGMQQARAKQQAALARMRTSREKMQQGVNGIESGIGFQKMMKGNLTAAQGVLSKIPPDESRTLADQLPPAVKQKLAAPAVAALARMHTRQELSASIAGFDKNIRTMQAKKKKLSDGLRGVEQGIDGVTSGIAQVQAKLEKARADKEKMQQALSGMQAGRAEMTKTLSHMTVMKRAVPGAFTAAEKNYLKAIDARAPQIEAVYQKTLNIGFRQIYMVMGGAAAAGLILLLFYRGRKRQEDAGAALADAE